jgi:hypothetical protein
MSLSYATLRSIVNMLADERSAHVAMAKLRDAARERRMLVSELIASVSSGEAAPARSSAPPPPTFSDVEADSDRIEIALGKRINSNAYGLRAEVHHETDRAWLVASPTGGPQVWLPKSQVDQHGEDAAGRMIFTLPIWLARRKGFL